QIQGFFDIPIDHLQGVPLLADYFEKKNIENPVIVSPDHGGVVRARRMADRLSAPIGIIDKRRPRSEEHTSELQSRFDLVCRLLTSPTSPPFPYTTLFRSHKSKDSSIFQLIICKVYRC